MGAQVGCLSAFQLGIHDHLSNERGGILNAYSRDGAYRMPYRTGALAVGCGNPAERDTDAIAYVLVKQTRVNVMQEGRYQVSWQFRSTSGVDFVYTKVYINGVAFGAEKTTLNVAYQDAIQNYDVDFAAGDLIEVWGYADNPTHLRVRNLSIKYDWGLSQFGDGTRNNLVTVLPLSDNDVLGFTAIV
jgi:hypothetical protein